jgi:hypothetical protein
MGNIADANNITVLFILLALAVVVLGALALFQFLRRDRHIQSLLDKRHQSPQPRRDAWAEAGRRLEAPSAKDLEDDSADAGDRDNEKTWTPIPPAAVTSSTPAAKPAVGASRQGSKQASLALVTGGAKRVGRAICLELARSGCDIIFTYNTSEADAASLCREVNALGREATSYRVDLNDLASVEAAASQWAQTLPDFTYIPVVSDALPEDAWSGRTGFVHRAVMDDFPSLMGHQVYACGAPIVVESARREFVTQCGLPDEAFFADSFTSAADIAAVK